MTGSGSAAGVPGHDLAPTSSSTLARTPLTRQLLDLRGVDADVRNGRPEGIHATRIAARRLRSTLTSYRALLPSDDARRLAGELRWLGGALSPARDAQVLRDRLLAGLADLPAELVIGPVGERIRTSLDLDIRLGLAGAARAMSSARYDRLLGDLGVLAASPVPTGARLPSARHAALRILHSDGRRAGRALRDARAERAPTDHDVALHGARKRFKRLHYSAESAALVLGRPALRLAKAAHAVQDLLGEHQDSVVARRYLLRLATQAHTDGDVAFTLGLLHAREEAVALEQEWAVKAAGRRVRQAARGLVR